MRQKRKKGYYVQVRVVEGFIDNESLIGKPEEMVSIVVEDLVDRKGKVLLRSVPDMAVIKSGAEFTASLQRHVEQLQRRIEKMTKAKNGGRAGS